jgi:hypothetical protein
MPDLARSDDENTTEVVLFALKDSGDERSRANDDRGGVIRIDAPIRVFLSDVDKSVFK